MHDARRAGIEHLDDQFGIVGGAGHLVALVLAPRRQLNPPAVPDRFQWVVMGGLVALVRFRQHALAHGNQFFLPGREAPVQRSQKLQETL